MNIHISYPDAGKAGIGHKVRSESLARVASGLGHQVTSDFGLVTDMAFFPPSVLEDIGMKKPDWWIIDYPNIHPIPDDIFASARKTGAKVCLLDGDGEAPWESLADLVVVQGCPIRTKRGRLRSNILQGAEYVIIRPEIFTVQRRPRGEWLVYGGSTDPLGVVPAFMENCKKLPAILLPAGKAHLDTPTPHHRVRYTHGDKILAYFGVCKAACIKFGMVAWELAALGVPIYAFVLNQRDMRFAKGMDEAGLIRAYPEVGLPDGEKMRAFLAEPFTPMGTRPNDKGAARILEAMNRV